MASLKARRAALWASGVIAVLVLALAGGWLFVMHEMKLRVLDALGPLGSAEEIDTGYARITLSRVRLRGPQGWPTGDTLRAERVILNIDMKALLTNRVHIQHVSVDGFYLSVARLPNGDVQLLPTLNDDTRVAIADTDNQVKHAREERVIDHVTFERGTMEFFDSTVSQPPYKILITNARANVDDLHLPALDNKTTLDMSGTIKGPSHAGTVGFNGWMVIASKDSNTHTNMRNVDIVTLDPYLLHKAGARTKVTSGTLDLTLDAAVQNYTIHAPGSVVVNNLQLSDNGDPLDTFLSIPTRAAIAALKSHGQIKLDFVLDGNLHDPKFSLNESLSRKMAAGFAKALGVSTEDIAKNAGDTVKGIGSALKNLLSK